MQDPFDMPAGEVKDPSYPVVREGIKQMEITEFKKVTYQDKKTGADASRLEVRLALTEDDRDTEGRTLNKGWSYKETIFLNPNEYNTQAEIVEQASMPIKAAFGREGAKAHSVNSLSADPTPIVGKVVKVTIKVKPEKDGRDAQNSVKKWWIDGK